MPALLTFSPLCGAVGLKKTRQTELASHAAVIALRPAWKRQHCAYATWLQLVFRLIYCSHSCSSCCCCCCCSWCCCGLFILLSFFWCCSCCSCLSSCFCCCGRANWNNAPAGSLSVPLPVTQSVGQSACFSLGFTLLLISCLLDSLASREETSQNEAKQATASKQSRRQLELLLMMSASQPAACVCPSYAN